MAEEAFPLHYLVWNNQFQELDRELQKNEHDVERLDPRGRTPLELSVCLGHLESTRVLLRHNADPTHSNAQGWTARKYDQQHQQSQSDSVQLSME